MRPALLNPLFAEVATLKGVGATLARQLARLKLTRVVDLVFDLPAMAIERVALPALDAAYVDRTVTVTLIPVAYDGGGGPRAPFRVRAADAANTWIDLVFFGQGGGYAKKLLPLGEPRVVSGRLDRYGQALQMAHPDHVVAPAAAATIPAREPVYGLTEGLTNKRLATLVAAALDRAPELPEWIEPSVLQRRRWPAWRAALAAAHALRSDGARDRLV